MPRQVPFSKLRLAGNELSLIESAIKSGNILGDGQYSTACMDWIASNMGVKHPLLTHSCTAALEMSAILADVGPGDEVIMPSFTFVSTANAFVLRGATPVFVDVVKDTLNIDPSHVEAAITPRTKAIVPVHYAGVACDMAKLLALATSNNLLVIEDAAQAIGSTYNGNHLGSIGHIGCLSFHQTKNVVSGEGGALLINDERFFERAKVIREKGTNRSRFLEGKVDKYTWEDIGSSYVPSELMAGFLFAQLQSSKAINQKRIEAVRLYENLLEPLFTKGVVEPPGVTLSENGNGHMMYCFADGPSTRSRLIEHLENEGVSAAFHYVPLHSSPCGTRVGITHSAMDVTDWAGECQLRLPMFSGIVEEDQVRVVEAIETFFE